MNILKRIFSFSFFLSLLLVANVYAQEVLIGDSAMIYPFEGQIGFQIAYSGKVEANAKPYLPDSATLFVGKNAMRFVYHGGMADSLNQSMLWDASSQKLWLLDNAKSSADSFPDYYKGLKYNSKKIGEKLLIAGVSTLSYQLNTKDANTKIYVSDSIYFGGKSIDSLRAFQPPFLSAGMKMIPLKSIHTNTNNGITTKMTAMQIIAIPQDEKDFIIPENFKKGPFDPFDVRHPIIPKHQDN